MFPGLHSGYTVQDNMSVSKFQTNVLPLSSARMNKVLVDTSDQEQEMY